MFRLFTYIYLGFLSGFTMGSAQGAQDSDEKKLLENVEHLIKKLPEHFELYKYQTYQNSPAQAAQDLCLYDWNRIGQAYQKGQISRAELYLFQDEELRDCHFFPYYRADQDSPRELGIYKAALLKTFGDPELVRLMEKCQPHFHELSIYNQILALPKDQLHAYVDDCLDNGVPYQIWNGDYTAEQADIYAELSNYITTKFLVSPNRLLNTIMYTYTAVFSVGTTSILYDQALTEKVFEIDERAVTLSLTNIYNILRTKIAKDLSRESLTKLYRLADSAIRRFPQADRDDPPSTTNIPARLISLLLWANYFTFEEVVKLSEDELLLRTGFMVEIHKNLADYFRAKHAWDKALKFYRVYQEYMTFNQDFYFKEDIDVNACLSSMALGSPAKECFATIDQYIVKLILKVESLKQNQVSSASIRDLAKLTVLQQDTINLNAKIRWYFYITVGLASLMATLIFFLFRVQKALRRKNHLIAEQKTSIQLILDEIADVIMKFDRHGKALPYSSRAAMQMFENIETLTIFQWVERYFKLPTDTIQTIQEVLRSVLNEPSVSWELNSTHLPREVELCGEAFAIDWAPIYRDGVTHEILISARNLSHLREVEELRTEQTLILTLVQGGPKLMQWVRALPTRLHELQSTPAHELARRLHTIKGEARTLQLAPIVESCHRLEQILRDGGVYQGAMEHLQISAARAVEALSHLELAHHRGAFQDNILDVIQRLQKEARQSLMPLGFQVQIRLYWAGEIENAKTQELLGEILMHAVNNSLDHGFVRPREQGQKIATMIQIEVHIEGEDPDLRIQIIDNGMGLDENRLRQLAAERRWQPEEGRPWTDIVFENGVSTVADRVSDRSGRGVGLSAIKLAAQELGLKPRLQARTDGRAGTVLSIEPQSIQLAMRSSVR